MARKKKNKASSSVFARIGAVCLVAYLGITLVASQVDIMVKKQELAAVQESVSRQQIDNTELQRLIASGDEMAYIERIAHDKLGYAAPSERVFIDISGK